MIERVTIPHHKKIKRTKEILLFRSVNSGKGGFKHLSRKLDEVKEVNYSLHVQNSH